MVADESALDEMPYFTGSGASCSFDFTWGRFEMSGVVLSTSSTSASVHLDELKFDADSYGDLDTYTLAAE